MEFLEFMMSFIRFRKFTAINSLNISYAPQTSPRMPLMDLNLPYPKQNSWFSPPNHCSPSLPQLRASHYPTA